MHLHALVHELGRHVGRTGGRLHALAMLVDECAKALVDGALVLAHPSFSSAQTHLVLGRLHPLHAAHTVGRQHRAQEEPAFAQRARRVEVHVVQLCDVEGDILLARPDGARREHVQRLAVRLEVGRLLRLRDVAAENLRCVEQRARCGADRVVLRVVALRVRVSIAGALVSGAQGGRGLGGDSGGHARTLGKGSGQ